MHMFFPSRGRAWTAAVLTAALMLIAGASAGVNTPQSGWYSGNPLLGGNNLVDLVCSAQTCYASGTFGTLLKSTDGGNGWQGVVTGLTLDLRRVRLAGSPDRLVVGGGCSLRRSDDGGDTFERLPFTASDASCPAALAAFAFPSSDHGYLALLDGSVLSTADGGRTFSRRTPVPSGTVMDLLCTSDTTCLAGTAAGQIQRTNDGGVSWSLAGQVGVQLNGLEQADATTLYAVGQGLTLFKSTDGGVSWERKAVTGIPPTDLVSIRCAGPDTCLLATRDGRRVARTEDGGDSFTSVVAPTESATAVEMASPARAIAVGGAGSAIVSDDAGDSWRLVGTRLTDELSVLEGATGEIAYAGGPGGALARTNDGGKSWTNVSPPTSVPIRAIAAPSNTRVFVLAADGALQRSDNGGGSYRLLNTGSSVGALDVVATSSDRVIVLGPGGMRRSVDGGETFSSVSDPDLRNARLAGADTAGSGIVAFGERRLLYSSNGGSSWRRLPFPAGRRIADVSFPTTQTGYLLDGSGNLWRTTNGGRRWAALSSLGRPALEVDFADTRTGYATIAGFGGRSYGFVLRTSDGGTTWRPQLVSASRLAKVEAAGGTAYALAAPSFLYATGNGGDVGAARNLVISTPRRIIDRPRTITVSGRLAHATPGDVAVVAVTQGRGWSSQSVAVASNGTFQTSWRVTGTATVVAHVLGNADFAGAGTKPLVVALHKPKR